MANLRSPLQKPGRASPEKATYVPATETVSKNVHAPGTTGSTPTSGDSLTAADGGAPASEGGHRSEGERQRSGPAPAHLSAAFLSARATGALRQ
eukprot:6764790-Pyramimonas_sp.AAC.1